VYGLVQKFKIERNPEPYPPHEGEYFVLLPKKDRHAFAAMLTYANSIEPENPILAKGIREWLKVY